MKTIWYAGSSAAGASFANNYAFTSGISPVINVSGSLLYPSSYLNKSYNGGEFSGLWVVISGNTRTSDTLIRFINNFVVGNQILTIPAGVTGLFSDLTNTDTVVAGDPYAIGATFPVTGGTIQISQIGGVYEDSSGNYVSKYSGVATAVLNGAVDVTRFGAIAGVNISQTSEPSQSTTIKAAGTLAYLSGRVYVNSHNTDIIFKTRVNGADGNCTITVPTTTTGYFEDITNSDSVVDGDTVAVSGFSGPATGTCYINLGLDYESSTLGTVTGNLNATLAGITPGTNKYFRINCSGASNVTQAQAQMYCPTDFVIKNARILVPTNTHTLDATWTMQLNGTDSSVVVTVPSATTGEFSDVTNELTVAQGDLVNWRMDMPGAGNATVFGMAFDTTEPAAPSGENSNLLLLGTG